MLRNITKLKITVRKIPKGFMLQATDQTGKSYEVEAHLLAGCFSQLLSKLADDNSPGSWKHQTRLMLDHDDVSLGPHETIIEEFKSKS